MKYLEKILIVFIGLMLLFPVVQNYSVAEAGFITPYSGTKPSKDDKKKKVDNKNTYDDEDKTEVEERKEDREKRKEESKEIVEAREVVEVKEKEKQQKTGKEIKNTSSMIIKVAIEEKISVANISMSSKYQVLDKATNKQILTVEGNKLIKIAYANGGISINGKKIASKSISLATVDNSTSNTFRLNNDVFRGSLVVEAKNGGLLIINYVDLEDYLKGTVPSEMQASWPIAALEAQAVAARTFAIYNKDNHKADGYDICDSTHCQVYEGVDNEASASSRAVENTRGQIMMYKGKPIYAAFHSSSGGMTENIENVWGTYLPYLRGVKDDDTKSPFHNWSVAYTPTELQNRLNAAGKGVGTLKGIRIIPASVSNGSGPSPRVGSVQFIGTKKQITLRGPQVRQVMGLHSAYFSVRVQKIGDAKILDKKDKKKSTSLIQISNKKGEKIVFDGHGFGHGIGMSQWGAKAMADKGSTWQDIINHYYTGIEIKKIY